MKKFQISVIVAGFLALMTLVVPYSARHRQASDAQLAALMPRPDRPLLNSWQQAVEDWFAPNNAEAQNATPIFPPLGPMYFPMGSVNGCGGTDTLASGVKVDYPPNNCGKNYTHCEAWANGPSALTYAAIGVECSFTATSTLTATATATATTAAYGGTTISTATATSTATTAAWQGLSLTASTLNASPVVVWQGIN